MATKNLGLIQALFVGTTPPTNTNLIWRDTNTSPAIYKSWDGVSAWVPLNVESVLSTGSEIFFDLPRQYGTFDSPITATTLTDNNTNATTYIQKIYHQAASFTPPASWVQLSGSRAYSAGVLNIIYVEYETDTRKIYSIDQF